MAVAIATCAASLLACTVLGVAVSISPKSRSTSSPRPCCGSIAIRTARGSWRQSSGCDPGCSFWIPWCDFTASTRATPAKWPSFRSLQRQLDLSVLLVHHTRKNAAGGVAAGQGLRGSGDIHAFGDSNLYLRRSREHVVLSSEHRAAPAATSVILELVATDAQATHLEVIGELQDGPTKLTTEGKRRGLEERVLALLSQGVPGTRAKLRASLGVKNERLGEVLESLERAGRVCRTPAGWQRLG